MPDKQKISHMQIIKLAITTILLLIAVVVLLSCNQHRQIKMTETGEESSLRKTVLDSKERMTLTIYYLTADGQYLLPLSIRVNESKDTARTALERLLSDPPISTALPSIPTDVKLIDIKCIYQTAYIDLTEDFLSIPAEQMQHAVDALAATILPLTNCPYMQLLIEGEGHEQAGGVAIGSPIATPVINKDENWQEEQSPLLYYTTDVNGWLVPHTTSYTDDGRGALQQLQLIAQAILPPWVSLLDYEIEGDLARLDLGIDSNIAYRSTVTEEEGYLKALINSVCTIEGINGLQVLLNGKTANNLPNGTGINSTLTPTPINQIDSK